jgi:lipoprotein-anchoring transpeptidase ErfK/SrfK
MQRVVFCALFASALGIVPAFAEPMSLYADRSPYPDRHPETQARRTAPAYIAPPGSTASVPQRAAPVRYASAEYDVNLGGGFIEFLFGGGRPVAPPRPPGEVVMARATPYGIQADEVMEPARPGLDPRYEKQVVPYSGPEKPGTIIIDTPQRFLFLVQGDGTALRYGIGVGRPGFTWAGVKTVTAKKPWPDWVPPPEMLDRRPDLPGFMAGGPENPLGARALYLGSTLYRIHGSNEPWTIGQAVSSGCIRMRNEDVIDLYERVKVGTKVVVI